MTLPFRRRHHDDEGSHDRARALVSSAFLEPLAQTDAAWLDDHLGRCPECRAEREALTADRALLRGLRERMPDPPRDLWARTAAAIESQSRPGRGLLANLGLGAPSPGRRRMPLGALSGALVVLVVVATALIPRGITPLPIPSSGTPDTARTSSPGATPLVPQADRVAWVRAAEDGSYSLVFANVDHACPDADPACAPLADGSPAPLELAAPPQAVVLSPGNDQIAVVGSATETGGSVMIVNVPTPQPGGTPAPSGTPGPTATALSSPSPTRSAAPGGVHTIIRGVVVVGSVGYSPDGQWFAFAARPIDGTAGPDLYAWHVGDAEATRITDDGATYFAGWYGDRIVASGIVVAGPPEDASPSPDDASPAPDGSSPSPDDGTAAPSDAASSPGPVSSERHPMSFLLDPVTGERLDLGLSDVWLPTIDPTGRFVTYWAGTVSPADPANGPSLAPGQVGAWRPAAGHLVLDGWSGPLGPTASPAASGEPSAGDPSAAPSVVPPGDGSASPSDDPSAVPAAASASPSGGPAGTPIELVAGPIADFDARFDPTGTRLAVWVLDAPDASAGRLWLIVLDQAAGAPSSTSDPMAAPGVQALRGFSIESGRLGWITPPGQDGQPSSVQVLAWKGDDFGQVQSLPGGSLQIVR